MSAFQFSTFNINKRNMGVRGLTTYINFNEESFLKTFLLHNTNLVIDGHSLCAQLYRRLNCFSAFGGDYDKYAINVKIFFKNIRKCNITPYVLFDGSYENRKLKTAYKRLKSKIHGASQLDPVTQGSLKIFPILLREVFIEVLRDMGVMYTVCEFEADDEIAVLARRLNCPVLSYDSDFFIYNVLYIPFNTLDCKPKPINNNERIYVLECKMYKVEHMTSHFGGLKQDMLPLLATLLGNDFIEKRVFRKFLSQLKLLKSKKAKNEQQRCIQSLLKWLQNETLDTAISKILGRLKKSEKDKVLVMIKKSIDGYNSTYCKSFKYFNVTEIMTEDSELNLTDFKSIYNDLNIEGDVSCEDESENDEESTDETYGNDEPIQSVPDWFTEGIRFNTIPKLYINLYTHHLHFCNPQAEDYTAEDSFLHTLSILRYAFDLLTDFSEEYCIYVSRENNNNYKRIFVDKQYTISRPLEITFCELSEEKLKLCFYHFIKETLPLLDLSVIDLLPSNFRIFMICILWWVAKCEVMLGDIHSLLICYIMLEVIDEKTGTFRGHHFFNNKYSKKIDEIRKSPNSSITIQDDLLLNKNKVQYEDCLLAASVLLKKFELDDKIKKKPKTYDIKKMHVFAQFQCCLIQFNSLNNLCRFPYESTKYSKSFNGTFVYNVATKLQNEMDPVSFMEKYINGATTVLMIYKSLCDVYNRCAERMKLVTKKWEGKKHRRRKNANKNSKLNNNINYFDLNVFESEVVI